MLLKQKVHVKAIFGNIGLLLHVPACMAVLLAIVCIFTHETQAIFPFITTAVISLLIGQFLFRLWFRPSVCNLWDAMITVALSWLCCSLIATLPFFWVSQVPVIDGTFYSGAAPLRNFLNSFFESISGFTTTGLSVIEKPSELQPSLQLWRSLLQWVGGAGLVVFILSIVEPTQEGYSLIYAEGKPERIARMVQKTVKKIWQIYLFYTFFGLTMLWASKMTFWEALNHSMTSIATGGFSVSDDSMASYSLAAKIFTLILMILGATSFLRHYRMFQNKSFKELWSTKQHKVLYLTIIIGSVLILLLDRIAGDHFRWVDAPYQWISSLVTCGFSTNDLRFWFPGLKLLLILAMFMGGASGSAAGGFKMRRVIDIFSGIVIRMKSLMSDKEKQITTLNNKIPHESIKEEEPTASIPLTEKTQRLYATGILFTLWILTLFSGWLVLLFLLPKERGLDVLFEATSAMSNVGLSTGIVIKSASAAVKSVLIFLMWAGRLEIVPILILFITWPLSLQKKHEIAVKKKNSQAQ